MTKKKSGRPKAKAKKSTANAVKLTNKVKNEFLKPYLDRLVRMKEERRKSNKKLLPDNLIANEVAKIRSLGVEWVTEDSLKKKLSRIMIKRDKLRDKNTT